MDPNATQYTYTLNDGSQISYIISDAEKSGSHLSSFEMRMLHLKRCVGTLARLNHSAPITKRICIGIDLSTTKDFTCDNRKELK